MKEQMSIEQSPMVIAFFQADIKSLAERIQRSRRSRVFFSRDFQSINNTLKFYRGMTQQRQFMIYKSQVKFGIVNYDDAISEKLKKAGHNLRKGGFIRDHCISNAMNPSRAFRNRHHRVDILMKNLAGFYPVNQLHTTDFN